MDTGRPYDWTIFKMRVMKKHYALIPLVASSVAAGVLCAGYIGYMCYSKTDLCFKPWTYGSRGPYQSVGPKDVRKFLNYHKGKYGQSEEIEALKKEIGSIQY